MALPDSTASILLLHNPRCSKSRAALALLEQHGVTVEVRRYLDEPLDAAELSELARRLDRPAREWVRMGEEAYRKAKLGVASKEKELLAALAEHPILLERPIAVRGPRAIVGRPPEKVLELLDES
ncbi:MAG TPA: arsenate reductase (glutaredoxin) [Planctomycetota bacterium]